MNIDEPKIEEENNEKKPTNNDEEVKEEAKGDEYSNNLCEDAMDNIEACL